MPKGKGYGPKRMPKKSASAKRGKQGGKLGYKNKYRQTGKA